MFTKKPRPRLSCYMRCLLNWKQLCMSLLLLTSRIHSWSEKGPRWRGGKLTSYNEYIKNADLRKAWRQKKLKLHLIVPSMSSQYLMRIFRKNTKRKKKHLGAESEWKYCTYSKREIKINQNVDYSILNFFHGFHTLSFFLKTRISSKISLHCLFITCGSINQQRNIETKNIGWSKKVISHRLQQQSPKSHVTKNRK